MLPIAWTSFMVLWTLFSVAGMLRTVQSARARRNYRPLVDKVARETGIRARAISIERIQRTGREDVADLLAQWDEWHESMCAAYFHPASSKRSWYRQPLDIFKPIYTEQEIKTFSEACTFEDWPEVVMVRG